MIIDDDVPETTPTPAPDSGAVFIPLPVRVESAVSDPSERHRLLMRADDLQSKLEQGISSTASAVERLRGNLRSAIATAREPLIHLMGLYRGNAARIGQEAIDSLGKIATNAQANVRRRIQLADASLWQTPARPVTHRSETAIVNTLEPIDSFAFIAERKAEGIAATEIVTPTAEISPPHPGGGEAGPTNAEVISTATDFGTSLRTPVATGGISTGLTPSPGGGGVPIDPPVGCEIGEDAGDPAYLHPGTHWFAVTTIDTPPTYLLSILRLAEANGATVIFTPLIPPSGTNSLWLGDVTAFFSDGSSFTYGLTFGKLNAGQTDDDPWNSFPGYPADYLPVHIRSAFLTTCVPGSPLPPPTSPPPPIIEEPDLPTTVPNPACCPPDPLERDDGNASRKFPEWPRSMLGESSWCGYIKNYAMTFKGGSSPVAPPDPGGGEYGDDAEQQPWWANWISETAGKVKTDIQEIFGFNKEPVAGSPNETLNATMVMNQKLMQRAAITLETDQKELEPKLASLLASYSLVAWAEKFTGAPLAYLGKDLEYSIKFMYPREIPGQSDVDAMYLTGQVDENEWECLTRSNGHLPSLHRQARDTKRTTPNIGETVDLYMRKMISLPEFLDRMKFNGVQNGETAIDWVKLREQIPAFQDIVRFMVRDTENPQVVAAGRLTDGFDVNFSGVLRDWAEQQGISEELALKFWVAHWDLPSPTMAFEMLRRLRPGRVPDSLVTTYGDVQSLLSAADYAPGWRERMTAISYLTPTRTDIKQGYSRGVYDRPEIIELLQDTGLDKSGAETVARLYDFEKEQFQRTRTEKTSAFTVKGILTAYIAGTLNRREAETLLEEFGFTPKRMTDLLNSADLKAVTVTREKCIRAVRRKYYVGAITDREAVEMLEVRQIDVGQAEDLVSGWTCERDANLQEVPARKNLQWAVDGVISLVELETRLQRLRYSPEDQRRYVAEATQRISEAVAKAAEKALRDQIAELNRRAAAARQKLKDYEAKVKEAEKKAKEAEKSGQSGGGSGK